LAGRFQRASEPVEKHTSIVLVLRQVNFLVRLDGPVDPLGVSVC